MAELTGRAGRLFPGQGRLDAHVQPREGFLWRPWHCRCECADSAPGWPFRISITRTDNVTFTYFGDGAANQGQVYETFNMASLWKLPVIFVIENNLYAMGTSQRRCHLHRRHLHPRQALRHPGRTGRRDGCAEDARGRAEGGGPCRAGKGPYILEALTYRYRGHSMSDPAKYRTREEVQKMRTEMTRSPFLRELLIEKGHADDEALKAIDKAVKAEVNAAADFAAKAPNPTRPNCGPMC
jgi:pyruvate dehydrogenase E1 component alpha subunit